MKCQVSGIPSKHDQTPTLSCIFPMFLGHIHSCASNLSTRWEKNGMQRSEQRTIDVVGVPIQGLCYQRCCKHSANVKTSKRTLKEAKRDKRATQRRAACLRALNPRFFRDA